MISGNPSSKCQRVWLQIRPTFDISRCTELKGLIWYLNGGMLSPARLLMRGVQEFLSEKLQVCKVLGGGSITFQVVHLLTSIETYVYCGFQWDEGPDPLPSLGSAHSSSSLKFSSHT